MNRSTPNQSDGCLYYVADPMCSWCWGFAPIVERIEADLRQGVELRLVLGGLAPDDDEPMSSDMRAYVQRAWRAVAQRTGASFDHSFWERCHPRRSTWPACRAVLAAGDRGREMFQRIQHAYYQEARDPSDRNTLLELGVEAGFERSAFARAIDAPATKDRLDVDLALRDELGVRGYPSLVWQSGGECIAITHGWSAEGDVRRSLDSVGALV